MDFGPVARTGSVAVARTGSGAVIPAAGAMRRQKGAAIADPGPLEVPRRVVPRQKEVLQPVPVPQPAVERTASSRVQERAEDLGPMKGSMAPLMDPMVPRAWREPTLATRATDEEHPLVEVGPWPGPVARPRSTA